MKITIKQHDTNVTFSDILIFDGNPANLNNCTVRFLMSKIPGDLNPIASAATIPDPNGGGVSYAAQPADVARSGLFRQEWEVTNTQTGKIQTYPYNDYNLVEILPDLG